MPRTLAVARIWLEVNSFSPVPSVLSDFENSEWAAGPAVLDRFRGTPTELGAVAAFADDDRDDSFGAGGTQTRSLLANVCA